MMNIVFRLSLGIGLLSALVARGSYACPAWSARLGLNLAEWLEVARLTEHERRRGETLEHRRQRLLQDLEARSCVIQDLLDHRLTLLDAAARFRDLGYPACVSSPEWWRLIDAGQTDHERWCRLVIRFVRQRSLGRPELVLCADQLESELAQRLGQGPLRLPDRSWERSAPFQSAGPNKSG